ncbi:MAG: glycosyltransferase [Balneolaceae bacterium]|nr:MAG: glycosyltransferase [Balneolaceae bacterium]
MRFGIVTPAHNEADTIPDYISSVIGQSILPVTLIIVNDNSTDNTGDIARQIAKKHDWITVIDRESLPVHRTGSKVVAAFLHGLSKTDYSTWDIIVKMDADLVLPPDYFKGVTEEFARSESVGICGGICALRKGGKLVPEQLTDRFHVRGALKAYRKSCYARIGGVRPVYGWDTLDELLAAYYNWETVVLPDLVAEHRAPTGSDTSSTVLHKMTGEMFYRLGYGPVISLAASAKRYRMKPFLISALWSCLGYLLAALRKPEQYVTPAQRIFIRKLRYRRMREKIAGKRA